MKKRLLQIAIGLVGFLLLAAGAGLLVLRTEWFREQMRRRVVAELEKATGGRVELAVFQFDPRRWHARLEALRIGGTLFRAEAIEVDLHVASFLRRDVDVAALRVIRPEIRIQVGPDGATNLPARSSGGVFMEPLLDLAVGRFEVRQGALWWNDRRYDLEAALGGLRAEVTYSPQGYYDGRLEAGRSTLETTPRLPPLEQFQARFRLRRDRIELTEVTARSTHSVIKAGGTITQLNRPRWQLQYDLVTDAREIQAAPLRAGRFQVQGTYEASAGRWTARGKVTAQQVAAATPEFRAAGIAAESDYAVDTAKLVLENAVVRMLGGRWSGRVEATRNQFEAAGRLEGIRLEALTQAVTTPSRPLHVLNWTGTLHGLLSRDRQGAVRADVTFGQGNIEGAARFRYAGRQNLEVDEARLTTPDTKLAASGRLGALQFQVHTTRLEELTQLALAATGKPVESPIRLEGPASAQGTLSGTIDQPKVAATLDLGAFVHEGRRWDSFQGRVEWSPELVRLAGGRLAKGKATISIQGSAAPSGAFQAEVGIRNTSSEDLAALAGVRAPVTGTVSAQLKLQGTRQDPRAAGSVEILRGSAWGEPFDSARAALLLDKGEFQATGIRVAKGPGSLSGQAAYHHERRAFRFDLKGTNLWSAAIPWKGAAGFSAAGAGRLAADSSLETLTGEGQLRVQGLAVEGKPLGDITATARATGNAVQLELESNALGSRVTGQAQVAARAPFPASGKVDFRGLDLAAVSNLGAQGFADGSFSFAGPAGRPEEVTTQGSVTRLEVKLPGRSGSLRNAGPLAWRVAKRRLFLDAVHLTGEGSDLKVSGSTDLRPGGALQLAIDGGLNLAVLGTLDPKLKVTGVSTISVNVAGTLREPNLGGRLEIRDASLGSEDLPLGIRNAHGVVTFSRRRATIQKITAEAGGGEVTIAGDAELGAGLVGYRLRLEARRVRLRYPQGLSSLLDGSFTLAGANRRTRLDGQIRILSAGTRTSVDVATLIEALKEPPRTPSANEWLQNTQLNIAISSAPNIRYETSLARNLQADVSLRLRGTALNPALLGRINITQGEVEFQGTRYTLNRGDISFSNPFRIEPLLNLDLETRVSGYDILLTLIGPLQKLNVTYRSDPPLTFNELVTLLAVGRAPTIDPTLAAQQTSQARAMTQIGADTLIGQTITRPVTGRLQRFFGVSRLKLDPELIGPENTATARVTLEQQVGRDVTFTYTYNLASAQEQIIRVRWSLNRQWQLEAIRDQNGLVGIDFLYKKRVR
jgi:translocation and assembly module TamB